MTPPTTTGHHSATPTAPDPVTGPDHYHHHDHHHYHDHCRSDALALVGSRAGRVLDVGCGSGATGRALLDQGWAQVVDGIELSPTAADRARAHYRTVVVGDLAHPNRADLLSPLDGPYHTVLCLDVLEHVPDPWGLLTHLVAHHLQPGGTAVISVPNVQCVEVVGPLLGGRWTYQPAGVLDRTHLRFFTRSSGRALVEGAGLEVTAEAARRIGVSRGWVGAAVGRALGPFGVRQHLFRAAKPGSASVRR